jgi:hypothetical protein
MVWEWKKPLRDPGRSTTHFFVPGRYFPFKPSCNKGKTLPVPAGNLKKKPEMIPSHE